MEDVKTFRQIAQDIPLWFQVDSVENIHFWLSKVVTIKVFPNKRVKVELI